MAEVNDIARDLMIANRILAREGVVDAYGHVSVRHPEKPERFLMSRSRSPELVEPGDVLEFGPDGEPVRSGGPPVYGERFIHAAILAARPDVHAVVHSHSEELIPFGITRARLRPVFHVAARMGAEVPVWDIRERFGDRTNLLVTDMDQGRDLAERLAGNRVVLMRGHGVAVAMESLHSAVLTAIYTQVNARVQTEAMRLDGAVNYLSPGEIETCGDVAAKGTLGRNRTWEYFRRRAGCEGM